MLKIHKGLLINEAFVERISKDLFEDIFVIYMNGGTFVKVSLAENPDMYEKLVNLFRDSV